MENTENKVLDENTETKAPENNAPEETTTPESETKETKAPDARDKEIANLKNLLSKANSEASAYKKKLRERQTAEEQAAADLEEQRKAELAELETLRREKQIASSATEFMSLGMDKELAQLTAQAKLDGDDTTVFANLRTLTENIKKNTVVKAMDNQGGLSVGNKPGSNADDALDRAFGLK